MQSSERPSDVSGFLDLDTLRAAVRAANAAADQAADAAADAAVVLAQARAAWATATTTASVAVNAAARASAALAAALALAIATEPTPAATAACTHAAVPLKRARSRSCEDPAVPCETTSRKRVLTEVPGDVTAHSDSDLSGSVGRFSASTVTEGEEYDAGSVPNAGDADIVDHCDVPQRKPVQDLGFSSKNLSVDSDDSDDSDDPEFVVTEPRAAAAAGLTSHGSPSPPMCYRCEGVQLTGKMCHMCRWATCPECGTCECIRNAHTTRRARDARARALEARRFPRIRRGQVPLLDASGAAALRAHVQQVTDEHAHLCASRAWRGRSRGHRGQLKDHDGERAKPFNALRYIVG